MNNSLQHLDEGAAAHAGLYLLSEGALRWLS
jgi:hypothetical protein